MFKFSLPAGESGHILVADNVVDVKMCNEFVAHCKQFLNTPVFSPGVTITGQVHPSKSTRDALFSNNHELWQSLKNDITIEMEKELTKGIGFAISYYKSQYKWTDSWQDINDTGYNLQVYQDGKGFYKEHIDGNPWHGDSSQRVLAVVAYLNPVPKGGHTHFPLHNVSVVPVAGRVCLFPATFTHPHESIVPEGADKWMVSTFLL